MRPIRLELKGFTSFREAQAIDFEELDLFAIAGPTGSGKSSILDAMTYALYGYVDRVGRQVGQLVSQGQPRMTVMLEFGAGERRYRVTRSTPARGASRIMLDRWQAGEWRQAGEGADRVREADAMIRQAVGLDYEAFTRSVLLPQGKFAEFLVGDAKDRRNILTELLGLELFSRLRERAGDIARRARDAASAGQRLVETEYAGVTEDAVDLAMSQAAAAADREHSVSEAEVAVRDISTRWAAAESEIRDLRHVAEDARSAATMSRSVAVQMRTLSGDLAQAEIAAKEMASALVDATKAADRIAAERTKAQGGWGTVADLVALRTRAEGLAEQAEALAELDGERDAATKEGERLGVAVGAAQAGLAKKAASREKATAALEAARAALDAAVHKDLVATVRAGVHPGDACPVCGAKVKSLPRAAKAPALDRAQTAADRAAAAARAAEDTLRRAERELDASAAAAQQAGAEVGRLDRELVKSRKRLTVLQADVAKAFAGKPPADPVATLGERIDRIEALREDEVEARERAREAERAAVLADRARDALNASVAEHRARLDGLSTTGLVDRATAVAGEGFVPPKLLAPDRAKKDPDALAEYAATLAARLEEMAEGLDLRADARGVGEKEFLEEAEGVVRGLVESPGTLDGLVLAVAEAVRSAAAARATAEQEVSSLRERLERAAALVAEVASEQANAARFESLARELRGDRIVAFLQVEALQILAAAGSAHLATLSSGRYALRFEEDEFFVIDTWNGDERRSARTLSGGETFLASLALALALSEQVSSLASRRGASLDSLFLDEGFGTLDPETLETVVDAIEQLGGDGRMVGVITHVQELAIRLPARIEIEKSPRGSRLEVAS